MVKVFSFCLYGNHKKYIDGFVKNVELILDAFPDFEIHLYRGMDVEYEFPACVHVHNVERIDAELMIHRFFVADLKDLEVAFVRDADSRITKRERWCIEQFLSSQKRFHIIRDHFWHKTMITGGLWGMKKNNLDIEKTYYKWISYNENIRGIYDTDQKFLDQCVYNRIRSDVLIHSIIIGHRDEEVQPIPWDLFDEKHFIGNVYEFDQFNNEYPVFSFYEFPFLKHLHWLIQRGQNGMAADLCTKLGIWRFSAHDRNAFLELWIRSCHVAADAQSLLLNFQYTHVTDENMLLCDEKIIPTLYKKVVATTNLDRSPCDEEVIIYYGNYPYSHLNLPCSNQIYRHAIFYPLNKRQIFESHPCWDNIRIIYIMNLEERKDRYMDVLLELCRMNAPLDKIHHYIAKKTEKPYAGATMNHIDVMRHFKDHFGSGDHALFLEDDFMFTSNVHKHQEDLKVFFERNYDFDVCLISTSKYHEIRPFDDLLNLSYQVCTTSSGYILKHDSIEKILNVVEEGYTKLIETGDSNMYCIDRYWSRIQKDNRFFVFKEKMGFQKGNYSSIRSSFTCYLD